MKSKGVLLVISGFAGTGKGTLVKSLLENYDNYALSVSATTRAPRKNEVEGVHYFYKTREEFLAMIEQGELVEYAEYVGNYYGTPRAYVEQQLAQGKDVILEIEIQGALKIKERFPDTMLLFLLPPDADTLKERLEGRGTETAEVIQKRLARAVEEAQYIEKYDYLVINDDLETCVKEAHAVIQSQHFQTKRNLEFLSEMKNGLEKFKSNN